MTFIIQLSIIAIPLITLAVIAFVGAGRFVKSKATTA